MYRTVKLYNIRLRYAHIFSPYSSKEGSQENYSVHIIIDKENKEALNTCRLLINEMGSHEWGHEWEVLKTVLYHKDCLPLRDARLKNMKSGHYIIARNKSRPICTLGDGKVVTNSNEGGDFLQDGCCVDAYLNFWTYDKGGVKRIGTKLMGLKYKSEGYPIEGPDESVTDLYQFLGLPIPINDDSSSKIEPKIEPKIESDIEPKIESEDNLNDLSHISYLNNKMDAPF